MYMYSSTDTNSTCTWHAYKCHTCSVATLEVIINKSKLHRRAHYVHPSIVVTLSQLRTPVYSGHLNHVWLLADHSHSAKLNVWLWHEQWWKMCAKFYSVPHTSVVSQSVRSHHLHCWMWWHAGHSHHSHTNDSGGPVANTIPQIPHYNGGIALHICRAKTVEEFVSETV